MNVDEKVKRATAVISGVHTAHRELGRLWPMVYSQNRGRRVMPKVQNRDRMLEQMRGQGANTNQPTHHAREKQLVRVHVYTHMQVLLMIGLTKSR